MAIKFIANYSKRLGLPGYSSHQYSISVEVELTDLERAPGEAARLYHLLQQSVDREIQQTGFVPDDSYGIETRNTHAAGGDAHHHLPAGSAAATNDNGNHSGNGNGTTSTTPTWQCSAKQHQLIDDLARRIGLTDGQLDERAQRLFRKPAHQLNKLSASGLISDMLAEAIPKRAQNGNHHAVPVRGNGGAA